MNPAGSSEEWHPREQRDPYAFTRTELEKAERRIADLVHHKTAKVGILAEQVAGHVRDLSRSPADPGWVKVALDHEEAARTEAMTNEREARKRTAAELATRHRESEDAIIERVADLEVALGEDGWVKRAFGAQNKKLNGILVAVGLAALGLIGNLVLKLADLASTGAG